MDDSTFHSNGAPSVSCHCCANLRSAARSSPGHTALTRMRGGDGGHPRDTVTVAVVGCGGMAAGPRVSRIWLVYIYGFKFSSLNPPATAPGGSGNTRTHHSSNTPSTPRVHLVPPRAAATALPPRAPLYSCAEDVGVPAGAVYKETSKTHRWRRTDHAKGAGAREVEYRAKYFSNSTVDFGLDIVDRVSTPAACCPVLNASMASERTRAYNPIRAHQQCTSILLAPKLCAHPTHELMQDAHYALHAREARGRVLVERRPLEIYGVSIGGFSFRPLRTQLIATTFAATQA
ncbi:hypothetical protein FB451DRAFT_1409593 [Mycena latifolia]|nr:hypothetical protein FB451DRAFT_1409593 [Mycena latifolia]